MKQGLSAYQYLSWIFLFLFLNFETGRTLKADKRVFIQPNPFYVPKMMMLVLSQILILAFLKIINEGSHMVMMECPDTVNTLLHEFFLWQPEVPKRLHTPTPTKRPGSSPGSKPSSPEPRARPPSRNKSK